MAYEDKSLEELEAMLNDPSRISATEPAKSEETTSTETAEVVESEPASEHETTTEAPAAEPEEAPAPAEHAKNAEIEELKLAIEEANLRYQKAEAERERDRFLRDRASGELGYWKRQAAEAAKRPVEREPSYDEPDEPADRTRRELDSVKSEIAELRREQTARAIMDEDTKFRERHPEIAKDEKFGDDIMPIFRKMVDEHREALESGDVKLARLTAKTIYEAAYAELRLARVEKARADLRSRTVEQTKKVEVAKAKASISASGATRSAAAREKPNSELSVKELEAKLNKLVGKR